MHRRIPAPWRAFMTVVGTVIGAGIFGIPYVYAKAGTAVGIVFTISIGAFLAVLNLLHGEALLRTGDPVRLPGLARRYLGKGWTVVATASSVIGFWGALLAYLLIGGTFLSVLLGGFVPLPPVAWQLAFYVVCGAVVAGGLHAVGKAEFWLSAALLAALASFISRLVPYGAAANLTAADPRYALLPYGVVLFALSGTGAIPTVRSLLRGEERRMRFTIVAGNLAATAATAAFGLAVVAVTGDRTTEQAIDGLVPVLGPGIAAAGAFVGLLAIATSFFSNGLYLRDIFRVDYGLPRPLAAVCALVPPLAAYFLGATRFIMVVGFAGAVFGAFDAAIVCLAFLAARRSGTRTPEYTLALPRWAIRSLIVLFALGSLVALLFRGGGG